MRPHDVRLSVKRENSLALHRHVRSNFGLVIKPSQLTCVREEDNFVLRHRAEIDDHRLLATAHQHARQRLVVARIDFLVRLPKGRDYAD